MTTIEQSLAILTVIAAAGLATVGTFAFRNRNRPGARGFAAGMFAAAAWSVVIAINIYPTQFLSAHVSMALRNGFILLIALSWLLFVVEYVRRGQIVLRSWLTVLVLIIPILTVLITITNPLHYLAFGPETPDAVGGGSDIDWGPWHLVFMAYAFFVVFAPTGLLLRELRTAQGSHRRQLLLILSGMIVGLIGANDYLFTGSLFDLPAYVRLSPFIFLISAGLWAVALFRYQLFGVIPVSRRMVVETIPDPVIAVDRNERVIDLNPAAKELFDVTEDATGVPLSELCTNCPALVAQYREGVRGGEITLAKGDTQRHFSVTTETIRSNRSGAVIVLRDITPMRQREQQLAETNEQLDQFAEFVTHDLRNPLTVAQLSLEMAQETDEEEAFDRVSNAHDRMEEMISSIRTLTKIDSGRVDREPVALETASRQAWEGIHTAGASLAVTDSTTINSDPDFMRHLLENLFRNAVEHGGENVTVTVGTTDDGFYIEDDGVGIPEDERNRIFEHGYSESGGTGFGLSIVETVCDVHNWEITVDDADGGGTRFRIRTYPVHRN